MPSASFFLYADDTTIIVTGNSINTFITNFTSVLDGLSHWFACNKLAINYKKTNCMFFGKKTLALKHNLAFNFQLDSHVLSIVDTVKFLGIYLDSNLNWHTHTTYIADKISKNTGLIRFASKYLPIDVLIKMYYAYIYPYIVYALPVWGSAPACYVQPITMLQKTAIRVVTKSHYLSHTDLLCTNYRFIMLNVLYNFLVLQLMHKIYYCNAPNCLINLFARSRNVHNHLTRNMSLNFFTIFSRTALYINSFVPSGIRLWNRLNVDYRLIVSFRKYKKTILQSLIA
jgi:hypothetical protein